MARTGTLKSQVQTPQSTATGTGFNQLLEGRKAPPTILTQGAAASLCPLHNHKAQPVLCGIPTQAPNTLGDKLAPLLEPSRFQC